MNLFFPKTLHYVILMFAGALILFGLWFGYQAIQPQSVEMAAAKEEKEFKGMAKPLPDFIVDKVKPDELEQLKP